MKDTFPILLGFIWVQELPLAFVRAVQKVLGDNKNVIIYVDDIVLRSPGFEYHLATLDSVLHKLTSKGFTLNASKCRVCRPEIR